MNRRRNFQSPGPLPILLAVMTCTGPSPLSRLLAELPANRVLVNVSNRSFNGLYGLKVPIITCASCQNRKHRVPGRSTTVNSSSSVLPAPSSSVLIRRENGLLSVRRK